MSPTVQALPTTYEGVQFRSRIEARWAVFFDHLGVRWDYEPEGFALPSGNYLPDFWLPDQDCYFEVKGTPPIEHESQLARELNEATGKRVMIAYGRMPRRREIDSCGPDFPGKWFDTIELYDRGWDNHYAWCICERCGTAGIEFDARSERLPCQCYPQINKRRNGDHPRILLAYDIARTQRFWDPKQ